MPGVDPSPAGDRSPIAAGQRGDAGNPSPPRDVQSAAAEEDGRCDGSRLVACLHAWALSGQWRFHYRIRCAASPGQLPGVAELGRRLADLSPPLPAAWTAALLRGWPPSVRGLHRIELVPACAWISVAIGLRPAIQRRLDTQQSGRGAASQTASAAIVVGAGLAGCAMADALLRRGWRVSVIEAGPRVGGAVAEIPLLAQHPALSPGDDRRSRLLLASLLATRRLADRFGAAMTWCGRFQPMALAEATLRTAGLPASVAEPVAVSDPAIHGVGGCEGIWFPDCAMADPRRWWQDLQQDPALHLRLSQPVAAVRRSGGRWRALDDRGEVIDSADVMILACQAQALTLAGMPALATGRVRLSRIQVAIGTAAPAIGDPVTEARRAPQARYRAARQGRRPTILGGSSYRLEDPGRHCVIGPLRPGQDSLRHHAIRLAGLTINDPAYRWQLCEPAERLLLRDNLPMIGAAPDIGAIMARRAQHEKNDRLPLPVLEALHLLTGLGGRGLLWSVLGAEVIAAAIGGEPVVVEPDLQEAVDPSRFLRRTLRRARSALAA